jgi:glucose-1-phosphate adenylyltransferase
MKIVAVVLAGGEGTRLYPLTAEHAKPAVPFANGYRIVDFVLSNLVNSSISTVYVLAQYKPQSLMQHIAAAWAPWFGDNKGTIKVLLPRSNTLSGQFKGTADAVYQYLDLIRAHSPDLVAVFAADHVYRMDVRQMVAFHQDRNAAVTVSALAVPIDDATGFGVLSTAPDGRVREFREKPKHPRAIPGKPHLAYASMGNYLFHATVLERVLGEARSRGDLDFGRDVLPRICAGERVYAYNFSENRVPGLQDYEEPAYWRDVGTLPALAAAQQDAMGTRPRFNLWNSRWPIHGHPADTGEHAPLAARLREWHEEEVRETEEPAVTSTAILRAASKERRTDERVQPS